ncbi:hypothetical protein DCD75_05340, partial [Acinetobacter baumannii]
SMVRGIANSKIGFGDLILLLRYFFKLKVSTHPIPLVRDIDVSKELFWFRICRSTGFSNGIINICL